MACSQATELVRQVTQWPCETNRIGTKESGSRESAPTLLALDNVNGVKVVPKDDDCPSPSTDELSEHISGHLPPWEISKDSHA